MVGTAHVSSVSAQLAGAAVKEIKPTAVFIELDPQRINRAFRNERITQTTNIVYFSESKGGQVTMRTTTLFPQDFEKRSKGLFQLFEKLRVQNPIQDMYEGLEAQGITPGEEVSWWSSNAYILSFESCKPLTTQVSGFEDSLANPKKHRKSCPSVRPENPPLGGSPPE